VVEQSFIVVRQEDGRLGLMYGEHGLPFGTTSFPTTENGQPVAAPYSFLDGEVTFAAAPPWNEDGGDGPTFMTFSLDRNYMWILADPLPLETGCEPAPTPADAEALARSIRSDPDLQATAPVAVSVGGIDALRMDVVAAPGASVCDGGPQVLTDGGWLGQRLRMRLYLLDLPEGLSSRILAIQIVAPGPEELEQMEEAAAPILDSFEFHAQ
jgi:hypothetical protein